MANSAKRRRRLWDEYAFPGFRPLPTVRGVFGDPKARVITFQRRSKKRAAVVVDERTRAGTTDGRGTFAICRVATRASFWRSMCVGCGARVAGK
jgi:maltooligosyltrehalose synthase